MLICINMLKNIINKASNDDKLYSKIKCRHFVMLLLFFVLFISLKCNVIFADNKDSNTTLTKDEIKIKFDETIKKVESVTFDASKKFDLIFYEKEYNDVKSLCVLNDDKEYVLVDDKNNIFTSHFAYIDKINNCYYLSLEGDDNKCGDAIFCIYKDNDIGRIKLIDTANENIILFSRDSFVYDGELLYAKSDVAEIVERKKNSRIVDQMEKVKLYTYDICGVSGLNNKKIYATNLHIVNFGYKHMGGVLKDINEVIYFDDDNNMYSIKNGISKKIDTNVEVDNIEMFNDGIYYYSYDKHRFCYYNGKVNKLGENYHPFLYYKTKDRKVLYALANNYIKYDMLDYVSDYYDAKAKYGSTDGYGVEKREVEGTKVQVPIYCLYVINIDKSTMIDDCINYFNKDSIAVNGIKVSYIKRKSLDKKKVTYEEVISECVRRTNFSGGVDRNNFYYNISEYMSGVISGKNDLMCEYDGVGEIVRGKDFSKYDASQNVVYEGKRVYLDGNNLYIKENGNDKIILSNYESSKYFYSHNYHTRLYNNRNGELYLYSEYEKKLSKLVDVNKLVDIVYNVTNVRTYNHRTTSYYLLNNSPTYGGSENVYDIYEIIVFGSCIQNAEGVDAQPIEWIVLDEKDGKQLLISKYIIENAVFSTNGTNYWQTSDIRKYLNGTCYNAWFNESEKKQIISDADGDKVSLLDKDMCRQYFGDEDENGYNKNIATNVTDYLKSNASKRNITIGSMPEKWYYGNSSFWIKTPVSNGNVEYIGLQGKLNFNGASPLENDGVRPIIWVNVDKK